MPKLRPYHDIPGYYAFRCPACRIEHAIPTIASEDYKTTWSFNGDMDKPTFNPSILITLEYGEDHRKEICHSFIRDGKIEFMNDCTHALAGQTVELPEMKSN